MTKTKSRTWLGLLILVCLLAGCGTAAPPTAAPPTAQPPTAAPLPPTAEPATPTPTPGAPVADTGILLSEVLLGVHGVNNNLEFVELYNAGSQAIDLDGWSLWYRLADNQDEELVYAWLSRADVPGHGHYLLVRTGQDVGAIGDATYDIPLFEPKGGLALRDPSGETVDSLVWGDGPTSYLSGSPVTPPENGASLERLPGGEAGDGQASGDNAADFMSNPTPNPQNSGDLPTPLPAERLALSLAAPATVGPGSEADLALTVENLSDGTASDLRVFLPVPTEFEVAALPPDATETDGWIEWSIPELGDGAKAVGEFQLTSPWTYLSSLVRGYYVETHDGRLRAYGPPTALAVEGGAIPIGTARTLVGKTVTVEGVATMYTGGFFAGSTGVKFYLEDETGGVQAYCPGGMGLIEVAVGDRVQVTGEIQVYRDSIELVPSTYPDDVTVLDHGDELPPAAATLTEINNDESLRGRLVVVEGAATRIAEYSYSYEVDLTDDEGVTVLLYVDKDTGMTTEPLDTGKRYRVTGIAEVYNGEMEILPRFQTDLAEIFPPKLRVDMDARNSVLPGETITYTLTAANHTDAPLTHVHVQAPLPSLLRPDAPARVLTPLEVLDGGDYEDGFAFWTVPELASGESLTVRYLVAAGEDAAGQVVADPASAFADEWPDPAESQPLRTFVGSGVPIWAIQGAGDISPYVRNQATTEGLVIGVFPELGGFWLQSAAPDDDPATSEGLFVFAGDQDLPLALGDLVRVSGKVREVSSQTTLALASPDDVQVLNSGNALPEPVALDPPLADDQARTYYEALEGMLVAVGEPAVAVGPTSQYGETPLVLVKSGIDRIMKGDPKGLLLFVDDGSAATHLDRSTLPFALQSGDTLVDAVGPLAYTYENYKIEPIVEPIIGHEEQPLPSLAPAGPNEFSIATFNAENLFDYFDPHPSDPPMPTRSEYRLDLTKMADAIVRMGLPTVVGLQEVENLDILAELVQEEAIAAYDYQPVLIEGTDSRGIDVGWLVRGDQATLEGAAARPAPGGLTSRPPLLITVTLHLESSDQTVYLLNNHFLSMSGGELQTEPQRKAQAAWNVTLVERLLAADPEANVVVLGDLNSFYHSPPLDVLREAGLRHVYELVEPDIPYSYIYEGESETLDHILVTPGLYGHLVRVEAVHFDADYPPPLPGDPSASGVSDHDPLVAVFSFK